MNDQYGTFGSDGATFVITEPRTPREWYNYLWNDRYVSLVSQVGGGESLAQDTMGRRIETVKDRMLYVRDADSGAVWSATALPADAGLSEYTCTHGLGQTTIASVRLGIATSLTVFVPERHLCEVWLLTVTNTSQVPRRLSLFPYVDAGLGGALKPQAYYMAHGTFDASICGATLTTRARFGEADTCINYMVADAGIEGWDTNYRLFMGYGSRLCPDAVAAGACTGSDTIMEKGILALQIDLALDPGASATLGVLVGAATSTDEIAAARGELLAAGAAQRELEETVARCRQVLGQTCVQTPDPALNAFAAHWLKRQIALGIHWARVRHNGYRDQVQDIAAFCRVNPAAAHAEMRRVLSYQYSSGYAPRTWLDGSLQDHDFSDNHVWIPMAVHALIAETGEAAALDEKIAFNDGSAAPLYEHAKRAVEYLWSDRALHGLCRMRSGDWNDCMNRVGPQGAGVSAWLSMAWCVANRCLEELAEYLGRADDAATCRQRGEEMATLIETHAWDGDRYVRAFDDHGAVLGASSCDEGRLFLNPQSWAVLAGLGGGGRARQAMETADRLLETEIGPLTVLDAYSHWHDNVGTMSSKLQGVQENGGVYLHASAFKLVADCLLKRHDKVEEALHKMLPFDHSAFAKDCEPYVLCNCYYATRDTYRYGTTGQSWGTGSAGWFYRALLDDVYGLRPGFDGLRLDPCLPPTWTHCGVERHFRGAVYRVAFDQSAGWERVASVVVNGQPHVGTHLPCESGETYEVEVVMGAKLST